MKWNHSIWVFCFDDAIDRKCKHCSSSCKKTADSNASCSMIYHALTFFGQAEYYANSCIRSAQIPLGQLLECHLKMFQSKYKSCLVLLNTYFVILIQLITLWAYFDNQMNQFIVSIFRFGVGTWMPFEKAPILRIKVVTCPKDLLCNFDSATLIIEWTNFIVSIDETLKNIVKFKKACNKLHT